MQLRNNFVQAQRTPKKTVVPPRRNTRASLAPVQNINTRLIDIPMNPVPIASAAGGSTPSDAATSRHKSALTATPALAELLGTDVETLAPIIRTFEQLVIDPGKVSVTVDAPSPAKRKSKKAAKGKATSVSMGNRDFKNYIHVRARPLLLASVPTNLTFQSLLREITHESFRVRRAHDFQTHVPASASDVSACEDLLADPGRDHFQWDFGPNYRH